MENAKALGCLVLFATPFAAVGAFVGYLAVGDMLEWWEARGWVEVPARIVEAELITDTGGDSTTYRVEALYDYEFEGLTYTGSRVSMFAGSDNIGSFHQDVYRELARHRDSGEPFRCFVNPEEPTEALLYRQLRPGMLMFQSVFALLFGGVGFGLMGAAVFGKRTVDKADELRRASPDEPWRWRTEWIDGTIAAGSKGKMIGSVIFAVLWNLVSAPALLFVPDEVAAGNPWALLALIFPLVGAGLAVWAVVSFLQWWRFGSATLELSRVPGVLGGTLEGKVHSALRDPPRDGVVLTLVCLATSSSDDHQRTRSRAEKIHWQDSHRVARGDVGYGPNGLAIPVSFALPYDAPESDERNFAWRLEVAARLPGLDYDVAFEVPVFRTPDSDPDFDASAARRSGGDEREAEIEQRGIVVEDVGDGRRRYVFGRARNPLVALGLTIFLVPWIGAIWFMVRADLTLLPLMFGLFAVFFVYAALDLWLTQRLVEVRPGSLRFARRMIGPRRWKEFPASEVRSIRAIPGMQSGQRLYHRLQLRLAGGEEHIIATGLTSLRAAEGIARDVLARLEP